MRLWAFASFESNLKTTKSTSAKRHPGEKQCTRKETNRPQRRSRAKEKGDEKMQFAFLSFAPSEPNRFCKASSGRKTMHRRRNNPTVAAPRSLEEKVEKVQKALFDVCTYENCTDYHRFIRWHICGAWHFSKIVRVWTAQIQKTKLLRCGEVDEKLGDWMTITAFLCTSPTWKIKQILVTQFWRFFTTRNLL